MKALLLNFIVLLFSQFAFSQLSVSITNVTNVACNGSATGSATAVAAGGVSPYTYIWATAHTTATISNVGAGVYTVTVTDSNMESAVASVTITQPTALNATTTMIINSTCFNSCNGMAQITASGGTPPYSYFWSNVPQCLATFCDMLCPGNYNITVTDMNGCNIGLNFVITQPTPMNVAISSTTNISCFGANNGSATASVAGGTSPYSYQWSNSESLATITNLIAGSYCVTVTDANGCWQSACTTITEAQEMLINKTITNASCGEANGSVSLSASNGLAPYIYILENDTLESNGLAENLNAGAYMLQVIDSNACSKLDTVIINDLGSPSIIISDLQNVSCNGYSDGLLELTAIGGQSPYTINWAYDSLLTSFTATNLSSGGYMVTVSDNLNCKKIQTFYITQPGNLFVGAGTQNANCTSPGRATVQGYGGIPPYSYLWSNNDTTQSIYASQGTYYVTVTDANNCENTTGRAIIGYDCKNVIKGKVFSDANGNCLIDTNDIGIQYMCLKLMPGNLYATTNSNGEYKFSVNIGSYTISNISNSSAYFTQTCPSNPSSHDVNFVSLGDTIENLNFAYNNSPDKIDLQVSLSSGIARPGFNYQYYIQYKYFGTYPISATLILKHDSILTYLSSNTIEDSYSNNELSWNLNLIPFSIGTITANFQVPTINNGGYIGRLLTSTAKIYPFENDADTLNNVSTYYRVITGSYDPNEKDVYPFGFGSNGAILPTDSLLTYTIHFQNTGTDTAFTVVLVDTLSQFVDPATVVCGASSHTYEFEMYGEGILKWTFNQILLVDSTTNEQASNGFVTYYVKQKANNPHESIIANKAEIFFDFNPEIVTNTTINTIDIYLNIEPIKITEINGIKLYPNPATDEIFIEISNVTSTGSATRSYKVYGIDGKIVKEGKLDSPKTHISTKDLESGIYIIEVNDGSKSNYLKLIVRRF